MKRAFVRTVVALLAASVFTLFSYGSAWAQTSRPMVVSSHRSLWLGVRTSAANAARLSNECPQNSNTRYVSLEDAQKREMRGCAIGKLISFKGLSFEKLTNNALRILEQRGRTDSPLYGKFSAAWLQSVVSGKLRDNKDKSGKVRTFPAHIGQDELLLIAEAAGCTDKECYAFLKAVGLDSMSGLAPMSPLADALKELCETALTACGQGMTEAEMTRVIQDANERILATREQARQSTVQGAAAEIADQGVKGNETIASDPGTAQPDATKPTNSTVIRVVIDWGWHPSTQAPPMRIHAISATMDALLMAEPAITATVDALPMTTPISVTVDALPMTTPISATVDALPRTISISATMRLRVPEPLTVTLKGPTQSTVSVSDAVKLHAQLSVSQHLTASAAQVSPDDDLLAQRRGGTVSATNNNPLVGESYDRESSDIFWASQAPMWGVPIYTSSSLWSLLSPH